MTNTMKKLSTHADVKIFKTPFVDVIYCLVRNKKELKSLRKQIGLPKSVYKIRGGATASCTLISCPTGGELNIVYINVFDDEPVVKKTSILVHEVVHLVDNYMAFIGETNPSTEFRAYLTDEVFNNLATELLN